MIFTWNIPFWSDIYNSWYYVLIKKSKNMYTYEHDIIYHSEEGFMLSGNIHSVKVAEDDIAFKLAILNKSLHLNDNTCFFGIIQSSKLVLGSLLAKYNFFVQFLTKNFASSRMANCGSGLPAEWPFRSQNAIEASDSPLPGGLWVKRLITHALCSLA